MHKYKNIGLQSRFEFLLVKNGISSVLFFALCHFLFSQIYAQKSVNRQPATLCNPMNLGYRYCLDTPSRREAADPTAINFKNEYYLFASKSGGYWHSSDLNTWDLLNTADLPLEDYAPTAVVIGDEVYFMASTTKGITRIYKTADPKSGIWKVANQAFPIALTDPDLYLDDDGRLYLYYGCSDVNPISVVELNRQTLMPIGQPIKCIYGNRNDHGWERFGDYNEKPNAPWIEGAWMTKVNGTYYLQYASPGTEFKSYCDGLYVSSNPLGPFNLAENNPFSHRPEGFIAGAGHSSTFKDKYGNFWRVSTMSISVNHRWERRLGLFPAFFGSADDAYASTYFGDFPFTIPRKKIRSASELFPNWMLLSYAKPLEVSSTLTGHPADYAADENIRTWWSAETGKKGEWAIIDLQRQCTVRAVQLNFADENTTVYGRLKDGAYRYLLECSDNKKNWKVLIDKSLNNNDAPHDYMALSAPIKTRYLRLTNVRTPSGNFAISGFRIFGNSGHVLPKKATDVSVVRDGNDRCKATVMWKKDTNSIGCNVRYGTTPQTMYQHYQVFGQGPITIGSLDKKSSYYFSVESFNGAGVKKGSQGIFVK